MPTDRSEYLKSYRAKQKPNLKRITVGLSREEYSRVEKEANKRGLTVTAYCRAQSLDEPLDAIRLDNSSKKADAAKEVVFLLRNIANNINQMAYHSNRLRMLLDENEPLLMLQNLEDEVKAFLKRQR